MFAYGWDPYFPAWPDVLQLNAFHPGLRQTAIKTLADIARQCDGVRCDMAMLLLNAIFERTWGHRAGPRPATEYWRDVIQAVKGRHPRFLLLAEAYWDREWDLQQQGFDYCYDKRLYDRLAHDTAESVRLHLCADPPTRRSAFASSKTMMSLAPFRPCSPQGTRRRGGHGHDSGGQTLSRRAVRRKKDQASCLPWPPSCRTGRL